MLDPETRVLPEELLEWFPLMGGGVRHPPQSGSLGEWGRLKGGCPVGLGVALKRAFVDEFRSCRYYHPRPLVRGCICELAPTRNPPWTLRIHGPRSARP